MMGAAAGAMGMQKNKQQMQQKNKFQQVRDQASAMNPQQGAGIGPSKGMMGGMMGKAGGGGLGQMAGAMTGGLGNRGFGRMKQNFQPRQDMGQPPQIGMSNTQLPQPPAMDQSFGGSMEQPPMMQQLPAPPMEQQQPQMNPWEQAQQQALAAYGPNSSLRRRPGIGPGFM
jgi:hypothetical protein